MRKKEIEVINEDNTVEEVSTESWFCSRGYTPPSKWDWKLIRKEWRKLGMPKDVVYDPFHIPLDVNNVNHCSYYMLFSKRGVGKTTTMIILGLILFKLYGVVTQYIRQKEDQLRPKFAQELMKTVLSCGYKRLKKRQTYILCMSFLWIRVSPINQTTMHPMAIGSSLMRCWESLIIMSLSILWIS